MQKHVAFTQHFKDVAVVRQLQRALRHKWLIQPGPHARQRSKFKEAGCVKRPVNFINLLLGNVQIIVQEFSDAAVGLIVNFKPYRSAARTFAQGFFHFFQQVVDIVFVKFQIGVARNAERHNIQNFAAAVQIGAVLVNNIFQKYKAAFFLAGNFQKARQYGRHLHDAHAVFALLVGKFYRKVQRFVCQKRKRARGVNSHRRKYRENFFLIISLQPAAAFFAQFVYAANVNTSFAQLLNQRKQIFV